MPKRTDIKRILVIGSGPIVIGQGAEFDYAGTQACISLKEEGYEVILVNSNPATIMTDTEIADVVYIEPLTLSFVSQIIRKERPDAILPTLGGQTGLNIAMELGKSGILQEFQVEVLGTNLQAIEKGEDRHQFKALMKELNEPIPESAIIHHLDEAFQFVTKVGYPVIVRPAFTLGGTGGGICTNEEQLIEIVSSGLKTSPVHQCLLEKSIAGLKEIEFEMIRDKNGHAIVVCHMENVDPVGIHTGDSIVVAPCQTLTDGELTRLRDASLKIVDALQIEGGCNVQLALDPKTSKYYVIEVNPRVSRSSALASKATGYPIAKIAAKIAVGYHLDEIIDPESGKAFAHLEPNMDYIVTKIPRFPFDKFQSAKRSLGTQMMATGEVMAIGDTFEQSLLKAVRSLEAKIYHLTLENKDEIDNIQLEKRIRKAGDERLFYLGEALRRGFSVETLHEWSKIDRYFLSKLKTIVDFERELEKHPFSPEVALKAKQLGFADHTIGEAWGCNEKEIYKWRKEKGIVPTFKKIPTYAHHESKQVAFYYGVYDSHQKMDQSEKEKVLVIGSGPIRIGQGIEFDYSTVHAVWALQEAGYEAIIINNNPETVSTDYSISDKLYFEPLTIEDVMAIIDVEKPIGVIVQFGGQTAINLASKLVERGVPLLGTSLEHLDEAEDRDKFEQVLRSLNVPMPKGKTALTIKEAIQIGKEIGYPVLVRPSYVLGGRAMEIVYREEELIHYMEKAIKEHSDHPVLIDRYLIGKEIEVDAICDGEHVLIPGIMEHIERAGVHSGDSIAVYPPQSLSWEMEEKIVRYTEKLAKGLKIIGLLNIQFIVTNDEAYVIEVNPRSSRTVPFLSKVTNIPMAKIATKVMLGHSIKQQGYPTGLKIARKRVYVKAPVFSFAKLRRVDITLGPEMKSTGEVMGKDLTFEKGLYKAFVASGIKMEEDGSVLMTIADKDKEEALEIAQRFVSIGYKILATKGTAKFFQMKGIKAEVVDKIGEDGANVLDVIQSGKAQYVINTFTKGKIPETDGFKIRREAVENGVPCFTSLDTARAILQVLESLIFQTEGMVKEVSYK